MSLIVADVQHYAKAISFDLIADGYVADFSANSLIEIDRFFDHPIRSTHDNGALLFALGSYVGEVLRMNLGGEWHGDDSDPRAEVNVELRLPLGTCWPIKRVMKRYKNGPTDGIAGYGHSLGLEFTRSPFFLPLEERLVSIPESAATVRTEHGSLPAKPWWRFWQ